METLERLVSETLRDAARTAPSPTGPTDAPDAPQRSRPSSLGALLAAAAALVVVIVSIIVVAEVRQESTVDVGPDQVPYTDDLVGFGDVAMPLPAGWSIGDYPCGQPGSNTVVIQPPGGRPTCGAHRPEGVSDIVIDDLRSRVARQWGEVAVEDAMLADGTPALIGSAPASLGGFTTTVVVVPDLDAVLVGTSPEPGELDDVMLATTRTPDDMVAVPALVGLTPGRAESLLDELGLRGDFQRVPHADRGVVVVTEPRPGVVVFVGRMVRVGIGR